MRSSKPSVSLVLLAVLFLLLLFLSLPCCSAQGEDVRKKGGLKAPGKPSSLRRNPPLAPPLTRPDLGSPKDEHTADDPGAPVISVDRLMSEAAEKPIAPEESRPQATKVHRSRGGGRVRPPDSPLSDAEREKASKGSNGWLKDIPEDVQQPYLLNIGTAKRLSDIMLDDEVVAKYRPPAELDTDTTAAQQQPGDNDVQELTDFFIWRKHSGKEAEQHRSRSITIQRPVVLVEDDSIVQWSIANWGSRSMRLLHASGGSDDQHLLFTLQATCKAPGTTLITLTLRTFEMTAGQRSKNTVEFTVRRTCAGAFGAGPSPAQLADKAGADKSTVDSTPIPGFEIQLAAPKGKGTVVVEHGVPRPSFKPREAADKDTAPIEWEAEAVVSARKTRQDFVFSYKGDKSLHLKRPIVVMEQPNVVMVTESMGNLGHVTTGLNKRWSLSFSCLASGSSPFTVIFTFSDDPTARVSFGMVKRCTEANIVEGVAGLHVDVGTNIGGRDVVADGETQPSYKGVTRWDAASWQGRANAFDEDVQAVSFFLSTAHDEGYPYEQPVVTAFTEDGAVIARPQVSGSLTTADPRELGPGTPLELNLEFRCEVEGLLAVTISVNTRVGSVQWTVRKRCSKPTAAEVADRKAEDLEGIEKNRDLGLSLNEDQTTVIPGLNIGFSRTAHGQMWNGVVNKDFRLRESSNELAICPANRHFLTFYLYQNRTVDDAIYVAYGKPELITTSDISAPILSGSLEGGVVNASRHASFTITFHCHSDGETMYTLTIPLLPLAGDRPPRSAVVLSFLKACNMSQLGGAEMGGLGIQGFSIGRSAGASDVVKDGFPTPHYFGQKGRDKPDWDDIIVPNGELSTTLYFSYTGGDNIGESGIAFHPPLLVSHSSLFKPALSGAATHGGRLTKNAKSLMPLHITWNCRFAGLVTVNLLIPLMDSQITFTIPKQCGGAPVPQGAMQKGLMVGLRPGGSEVVKDGLVGPEFAGKMWTVGEDETTTVFYIRQTKGVFQAIEPMVRSHRSIALPMLVHDMYVSKGQDGTLLRDEPGAGKARAEESAEQAALESMVKEAAESGDSDLVQDEFDDVYVDSNGATLNVSYSCLDAGSTKITLTIPLKVGYLEWTWVKVCPAAEDWGLDNVGSIGIAGIRPGGLNVKRDEQELHRPDAVTPKAGSHVDTEWDDRAARAAAAQRLIVQERHDAEFINDPLERHMTKEDSSFTDMRYVVVSSSLAKAKKLQGDVFDSKGPKTRYQRPTASSKGQHTVIDAASNRTSFFIASARSIRIAQPSVLIPEEFRGRRVVTEPRVSVRGGELRLGRGREPLELVIDWNCMKGKGGFTPAYVTVPLEPQPEGGRVQFYLTKLCPGEDDGGNRGGPSGWSMYAMIVLGVIGSVIGVMYYSYGREKELRILIGDKLAAMRDGRHTDVLKRGTYEILRQTEDRAGT